MDRTYLPSTLQNIEMNRINFNVIFLVSLLSFLGCRKECQFDGSYAFVIPAQVNINKDTIQIGDTLTWTSSFTKEVYEQNSDQTYNLKDFKFYPYSSIIKIGLPNQKESFEDFEVLLDSNYDFNFFTYSDGAKVLVGQYNYSNDQYDLAYKLIPKAEGLYLFCHGSEIYGLGEDQDFDGKCKKKSSDVYVSLNEGVDNNVNLLRDSPDPHYNDWILIDPQARFHNYGCYCFYVKE